MVRNGKYRLVVYDNGEKIYDGRLFNVKNNIINRDIGLTLWEQVVKAVKEVLDNPIVEETNDYVAPTAVSVVAVSTFVAMPWWSFINYFQSFFTEPLAWLFRRKKKGWGVVYNSITKKPIDLAVVRLYDKTTGKLLKSRVTDKQGRYSFLVSDGSYTLQVVKPNMVFPSNILKNISEDKQFVNLYHGDDIIIGKDQKGIITANIPVDPSDAPITDKEVIRQNIKYKIHKNISLLGPILALVSLAVSPTILIGLFAVLHILLYFIFNRLIAKEKVNKWGVILDAKTGQPVAGTVTKIYSPEYNKMLEAQVTDRHGRYGFLAGNNVYYIAATKDGYLEAKTDNIDLTHKKSEEVIGQDLELHPMDNQSPIDNSQQNEITKSLKTETQNHAKPAYRQAGTENTKTEEDTKPIKQSEEKEESPLKELADKLNQEAEKNIPLPTSTSIPEPTSEPIPEPTSNISSDLDNQTGDRVEAPKEQIEPVVINKPESESKFG